MKKVNISESLSRWTWCPERTLQVVGGSSLQQPIAWILSTAAAAAAAAAIATAATATASPSPTTITTATATTTPNTTTNC